MRHHRLPPAALQALAHKALLVIVGRHVRTYVLPAQVELLLWRDWRQQRVAVLLVLAGSAAVAGACAAVAVVQEASLAVCLFLMHLLLLVVAVAS